MLPSFTGFYNIFARLFLFNLVFVDLPLLVSFGTFLFFVLNRFTSVSTRLFAKKMTGWEPKMQQKKTTGSIVFLLRVSTLQWSQLCTEFFFLFTEFSLSSGRSASAAFAFGVARFSLRRDTDRRFLRPKNSVTNSVKKKPFAAFLFLKRRRRRKKRKWTATTRRRTAPVERNGRQNKSKR